MPNTARAPDCGEWYQTSSVGKRGGTCPVFDPSNQRLLLSFNGIGIQDVRHFLLLRILV